MSTPSEAVDAEQQPTDAADPAERVAAAVCALDAVHDLHGGVLGEIATYLPGRRIAGVRVGEDGAAVHVVLTWGAAITPATDAVRATVRAALDAPALRVDVVVEDVAGPGSAAPRTTAASEEGTR